MSSPAGALHFGSSTTPGIFCIKRNRFATPGAEASTSGLFGSSSTRRTLQEATMDEEEKAEEDGLGINRRRTTRPETALSRAGSSGRGILGTIGWRRLQVDSMDSEALITRCRPPH